MTTEPDALTVLVYSDDPSVREGVRTALGRRPVKGAPPVEYLDADNSEAVVRAVDTGTVDLGILDGEAWPTGGMGICRQLKDEIADCPPMVVLIARRDDAWLATWSQADGVLAHPLDPVQARDVVADVVRRFPRGGKTDAPPHGGGVTPYVGH